MARQPSGVARFFGYMLIAIGVLITFLSGACTLFVLYSGLSTKGNAAANTLLMALIFGLPFIGTGIALIIAGRVLSKRDKPREPPGRIFE